jgi:hypothetical protein
MENATVRVRPSRSVGAGLDTAQRKGLPNGVPFIVLTCTQRLRSFPLSILRENLPDIQEAPSLFCLSTVRYVIDFSVEAASPKVRIAGANR